MPRMTTPDRRTSPIFEWAARRRQEMLAEFQEVREREFALAEQATRGRMRRDETAGPTSWEIFMYPANLQRKYASRELLDHLRQHPRTGRQQFEADWFDRYLTAGP